MQITLNGYNKSQDEFLKDWKRGECAYVGGLGSGKSWALIRKLIVLHIYNQCPSMIIAPTYGDLYRIDVPELQSSCLEWNLNFQVNSSGKGGLRFPHVIVEGSNYPIYLMTGDEPSRLAGFEVGVAAIDEAARVKESLADPLKDCFTQARSRIRHSNAKILQLMVASTPEGTDNVLFREYLDKESKGRVYRGVTYENPYLPEEYITSLKASYPPELAEQYLGGKAVTFAANRAHKNFSDENILPTPKKLQNRTYFLGADFNVCPMTWVLGYVDKDVIYFVDELVLKDNANVEVAMHMANLKGWGKHKIQFFADPASNQRSTVGDSEIKVMIKKAQEYGWNFTNKTAKKHPKINTRINLFDASILNSIGERKLFVYDCCERLIDELKNTGRGNNGYDPGKNKDRGHILDAASYPYYEIFHHVKGPVRGFDVSLI